MPTLNPLRWGIDALTTCGLNAATNPFPLYALWAERYGPTYRFPYGDKYFVVSSDTQDWERLHRATSAMPPPLVNPPFLRRDALLKEANADYEPWMISMEGPEWKTNRKVLDEKLMIVKEVEKYTEKVDEIAVEAADLLVEAIRNGKEVESIVYNFSTEAIAAVLFDYRIGVLGGSERGRRFIKTLKDVFARDTRMIISPFQLYMKYNTPQFKKFLAETGSLMQQCDQFVKEAAKYHEENKTQNRTDMLYHMTERGQSEERVASNAGVLFFAGADSTSNSLLWLLHNLGRNQDVLAKVIAEVKEHVPDDRTPLSAQTLRKLKYVRKMVKESMRLTPTGPGVVRTVECDDMVVSGYEVPRGTMVFMNQWLASKDPAHFPDPYRMDPSRWDRGQTGNPFIQLPFGWGPRACQGFRVSELEMHLFITRLAQKLGSWKSVQDVSPYMELFVRPDRPLRIETQS